MTTASMKVAQEVRAAMARERLTQESLAEQLGMAQTAVSRRLTGRVAWDINELVHVAEFLGVPLASLLPDDGKAAS